jgi:hypothetical protein
MIDLKDLIRPPVLLALAGSAAVGFAAGYLIGRDPQLLRRVLAAAAQGWEQTRLSVAEAREDLADQWAEATESARHDMEEKAFAAATAQAEAASVEGLGHPGEAVVEPMPLRKPKRRAPATSARRPRAGRTAH